MKLTKNKLRDRKIYNEYNLAALQEPKVWVQFTPPGKGRDLTVGGWRVHRVGYNTDPNNKFDSRTFINRGPPDKEEKRLQALGWAGKRYGISEWERSPFGSYHPVGTLARAAAIEATP